MAELLFQSKQEKLPDGSPIIITKILGAIDGTTVRQFEDKLIGFFNQGVKNLILIFSDVKYINSTGMGLLVKLADKFQEGGGDIKLVGVPEKVIALFDMLGLLSLFKIYENEEDAVDSITQSGGAKNTPPAPPVPPPPVVPPAAPKTVKTVPTAPPQAPVSAPPRPQPKVVAPVVTPPPFVPPAPPAPASADLGGGFDLSAGIEIGSEEEMISAPSVPVSWPHDSTCISCSGPIQFAAKGNYKCPRCNSFVAIDEFGKQTLYGSVSSKIVELTCPANNAFMPAAKAAINALAQSMGFSNIFNDEINVAIENAIIIAIEKSNQRPESFQILGVVDANEMIVGIKALNPFLVQGGPKDPRLPLIARKVDRLEVFPLPNKGQLLSIPTRPT